MDEDYITKETHELAKSKGIDTRACRCGGFPDCICQDKYWTQSLLHKCLMKRNLFVGVTPIRVSTAGKTGIRYTWYICNLKDETEIFDKTPLGMLTYPETVETGLQEALRLLHYKRKLFWNV